MVRTAILSVAAACTLFALIGCNNRAEVDALQPAQAAELKPMQQSWRGVLPCADCEGIETSLFLEKDGTWVMNERYQGVREEPSSFASYGTWARTADKLVLTDSNGEKSYYRAKGNALEMLDREGNPVASQLNYTLVPVTASLPVASNAQLERGYLAAKGEAEKPVLLTVEGHFVFAANPDTGEPVKTLIADKNAKFAPGKDCTH
ncbi:envelope stress response activation lipoprotein NlpE [Salmonella enterica subsp. enterica serovar Newport]|nr:envelope stress response activation lipoprotein NlpE [Salmonella enterica subsp. enterica serovar Newport]EGT6971819.1 envelope stress response activation lipoprotein NlpE [Salmonella enterica]ELS0255197.1 envelope stress response activation lipoprotein NlpE [Salmonella enterica]